LRSQQVYECWVAFGVLSTPEVAEEHPARKNRLVLNIIFVPARRSVYSCKLHSCKNNPFGVVQLCTWAILKVDKRVLLTG